jgi:hypothetical protein
MLWKLIDVLAFIVALGLVVTLMPGTLARRWRGSLLDRMRERESERDQSKASPRRESSSTK